MSEVTDPVNPSTEQITDVPVCYVFIVAGSRLTVFVLSNNIIFFVFLITLFRSVTFILNLICTSRVPFEGNHQCVCDVFEV